VAYKIITHEPLFLQQYCEVRAETSITTISVTQTVSTAMFRWNSGHLNTPPPPSSSSSPSSSSPSPSPSSHHRHYHHHTTTITTTIIIIIITIIIIFSISISTPVARRRNLFVGFALVLRWQEFAAVYICFIHGNTPPNRRWCEVDQIR